ncbi:MAG: substrate-binding domain-containing protein, partial [Anaerolineae bacterium]|nr:substrate-binding domain-containing protein [Anaerolineae bacterium]
MSTSTHHTIGLLAPTIGAYDLWLGVLDTANSHGARLISFPGRRFQDARQFYAQANTIYDLITPRRVDGLVMWSSAIGNNVGREAMQGFCDRFRPLPLVSIGMVLPDIPSIVIDNYSGLFDATSHLIEEHGCSRLAFIRGMEGHQGAEDRYRGYLDALARHNIPFDPALVSPPNDWRSETGRSAVRVFIDERQVPFDAVVASSDDLALGAIWELEARGIHVPGDIPLTGFNDSWELQARGIHVPDEIALTPLNDAHVSRMATPPLTTVPLEMYELARQATTMLMALIDGRPASPSSISLPTHLLVRQSCGCQDPAVEQASIAAVDALPASSPAETDWATQRAPIITQLAEAIRSSWLSLDWARRLAAAFVADIEGGDAPTGAFLGLLAEGLQTIVLSDGDAGVWQGTLSELRRRVLPYLLANAARMVRAESILAQGRLNIAETVRHTQAYTAWQRDQRAHILHEIERAMTTAASVPELLDVLALELPRLGIPGCYLSLYADPNDPTVAATLVMAYNAGGRIDLPRDGLTFPSWQLIPDGLMPQDGILNLVVESLHYHEDKLGFIVFEVGMREGSLYDLVAEQISSVLKGAFLLARNVRLYQEALEAQEEAREANRLKSRFLSIVGHELRTPLSLLVGLSELLLREETKEELSLPAPYRQDLERIHVNARQLDGLLRDVLDLTLSEIGQLRLVKRPVSLAEIIEAAALIGQKMAEDKGLVWQVSMPDRLPYVWADPMRLQQVILNLINNAVKFTRQGSIRLVVEPRGDEVTIKICDTGIGVPQAEQEIIFDEFRQAEGIVKREYGGLGIGLALCRQLVELHEGKIGVQSPGEELGGSTFFFTLPVLSGAAEIGLEGDGQHQVVVLTHRAGSSGDLIEYLVDEGFNIRVVEVDGAAGWLSQLAASPPSAIVLDCQPATEQGWALVNLLKDNPATADIPVLFYSLPEGQDSGSVLALDYLTKPVDAADLIEALQRQGMTWHRAEGGKAILIVDDEPAILDLHARIVQTQMPECTILRAGDGREALAIIEQARPDLVLLDLMMPEMDGFKVLEAMRESEASRNIPVIVLTARAITQEDMARLNRGVSAILQKGIFSAGETLSHVSEALARSKSLSGET